MQQALRGCVWQISLVPNPAPNPAPNPSRERLGHWRRMDPSMVLPTLMNGADARPHALPAAHNVVSPSPARPALLHKISCNSYCVVLTAAAAAQAAAAQAGGAGGC